MKQSLSHILLLVSLSMQAQTFDFSCDPQSYSSISTELVPMIQDFIADLDDPNVIIENITAVLGTRDELITLTGYTPSTNTVAFAYTSCGSRPYYRFYYVKEKWDNQTNPFRKKVVYHELGHTVLKYNHNRVEWDIMAYNSLTSISIQWINSLARLITGEGQISLCSSNRGGVIITEN